MLPAAHRLSDAESFRLAVRRGRRSGSHTVVVHLGTAPRPGTARVGFVVSKAVGNAVVRNRVKRRLRHLAGERVAELPDACLLVVRALPAASEATYAELGQDLGRCLERVLT